MLDAVDIPHEGSAVMAESVCLAVVKSTLQKLMFENLSSRPRHKHLQIGTGNITQSSCFAGKSTLLKLMCGDLYPTRGDIKRHSHLVIGRYHQHSVDVLDDKMEVTVQ